jgi:hypothetical protein
MKKPYKFRFLYINQYLTKAKNNRQLTSTGKLNYSSDKWNSDFDFYIKAEFNLNYDNQTVTEGNFADYVFSSGFGWELK